MEFHSYPVGCYFKTLSDIKNSHVTVMGLGLNGGGESVVRFLLKYEAYVTVTDMKTAQELQVTIDSIAQDDSLDKSRLKYVLGEHRLADFSDADCVIKNPGIKYEGNKYLAVAKAIETDISMFLHFTKAPIIAVTGSKGKSSTVSAIYYGLCESGSIAFLGGNITVSPLTFLEKTNESTPVVLELSSWQLGDLRGRHVLKPLIAVITKIVPDHQNFYHSMNNYIEDKKLIYAEQDKNDFTIVDADSDELGTGPEGTGSWGDLFAHESKAFVLRYSKRPLPKGIYGVWQERINGNFSGKVRLPFALMSKDSQTNFDDNETILGEIAVPGDHIKTNVLNAALVLRLMGRKSSEIIRILGKWQGLNHRLQFFHSWKIQKSDKPDKQIIVKFYNDSCATVPEAAAAASQSFKKPVFFLCGGTAKGLPMNPLTDSLLCKKGEIPVHKLYLLAGTATDNVLNILKDSSLEYSGPFTSLSKMLKTVKKDIETENLQNDSDPVVVFSPGATSFGMFANEFDRGDKFMKMVKDIF